MKTFAKTLLAGGLGLFGLFGSAQAALPYGSASQGIAVGGCYGPDAYRPSAGYGHTSHGHAGYGRPTRDVKFPRSAFGEDRFRTLPYPASGGYGRGDDCGYGSTGRFPAKPTPSSRDRHDYVRYEGSSLFEPWRPANASHGLDRRNW